MIIIDQQEISDRLKQFQGKPIFPVSEVRESLEPLVAQYSQGEDVREVRGRVNNIAMMLFADEGYQIRQMFNKPYYVLRSGHEVEATPTSQYLQ